MRPIWRGHVQFGLVTIPVDVYSATSSERISFHLLHKEDHGRVHNKRVCELDGKELSAEDIVKGYEYEKDEYVELNDEDFKKIAIESTRVIEITDFVSHEEIDPMFFDTPYYLAPGKSAVKPYALLREVLKSTGKVGIGKVAIRQREYLASVKAHGAALMLDTMHFADEITSSRELELPEEDVKVDKRQLKVAEQLVDGMSAKFEPEKYKDTYREALLELIEKKVKGGTVKRPSGRRARATNVVDIMDRLKQSLEEVKRSKPKSSASPKTSATPKRSASRKKKSSKSRAA